MHKALLSRAPFLWFKKPTLNRASRAGRFAGLLCPLKCVAANKSHQEISAPSPPAPLKYLFVPLFWLHKTSKPFSFLCQHLLFSARAAIKKILLISTPSPIYEPAMDFPWSLCKKQNLQLYQDSGLKTSLAKSFRVFFKTYFQGKRYLSQGGKSIIHWCWFQKVHSTVCSSPSHPCGWRAKSSSGMWIRWAHLRTCGHTGLQKVLQ